MFWSSQSATRLTGATSITSGKKGNVIAQMIWIIEEYVTIQPRIAIALLPTDDLHIELIQARGKSHEFPKGIAASLHRDYPAQLTEGFCDAYAAP